MSNAEVFLFLMYYGVAFCVAMIGGIWGGNWLANRDEKKIQEMFR